MRKVYWLSILLFTIAPLSFGQEAASPAASSLRVMTFNLWVGGEAGGQPLGKSVEVIRAAQADLIGLQETGVVTGQGSRRDNAAKLAALLGFHYFDQGGGRGILSRFPIVTNTPGKWGVQISVSSNRVAWMFNVHLAHAPYQPYQLLEIPYEGGAFLKTAGEAEMAAKAARGHDVQALLKELREPLRAGVPVFVTGDFNEPSHRDWTPAAARAGLCPVAVEWPSTKALADAGLVDSFRAAQPDERNQRGLTWTPITREDDPKDRHDRIDFVFFRARDLQLLKSEVVGEKSERAAIVVKPYPSDHRAVVSTFQQLPTARTE